MRKITPEALQRILIEHQLWLESRQEAGQSADLAEAYLQGAYLRGANLRGADLRGADLAGADLQGANLQGADLIGAYLTEAKNLLHTRNAQYARIDEKDKHLFALNTQPFNDLNKDLEQSQLKIKNLTQQITQSTDQQQNTEQEKEKITKDNRQLKQQLKDEQQKITTLIQQIKNIENDELNTAIKEIGKSKDNNNQLLNRYQWQSLLLMWSGLAFFILAIAYVMYIILYKSFNYSADFLIFSPSFLLSIIAISLLRHDWKIRQLASQLIEKNNHIDNAMGILRGSLSLSRIGDDNQNLLKTSFEQVKVALLFSQNQQNNPNNSDNPTYLKIISDLIKQNKS